MADFLITQESRPPCPFPEQRINAAFHPICSCTNTSTYPQVECLAWVVRHNLTPGSEVQVADPLSLAFTATHLVGWCIELLADLCFLTGAGAGGDFGGIDFSKLGGGAGLGGMGGLGGEDEDDEEELDDDDMPALEGEEEDAAEEKPTEAAKA